MQLARRNRLQEEMIWVLGESSSPLNLDQLVHHVFRRQQRITTPLVLNRKSIRRKVRLKRRIQDMIAADYVKRTWSDGEVRFSLDPAYVRPDPEALHSGVLTLIAVAIIALAVSVSIYLVAFLP